MEIKLITTSAFTLQRIVIHYPMCLIYYPISSNLWRVHQKS
jgi:hypothetical protein